MKTKTLGDPLEGDLMGIVDILVRAELVISKADGKRMVCQEAVKVNGVVVDRHFLADFSDGILTVTVGKRRIANVLIAGG